MFFVNLAFATATLLQAVTAAVLSGVETILVNNVIIPKTKSNFAKNNVSATWAPNHPQEWGSEAFHYQFGAPDPSDHFSGAITSDEKYAVLFNGSHVQFIDLDKNTTAATLPIQVPEKQFGWDFSVRASVSTQGEHAYDIFVGAAMNYYDTPVTTTRQRISTSLQSLGTPIVYQGSIGSISPQGKLASSHGYIYDLSTASSAPVATLNGQPDMTDFSFGPDGVHLATVSWHEETADLWNATDGQKIFTFPATRAQNWVTRISPDGRHVAIALGSANNTIQIYTLSNLTAPPIEIKGFNDWPRQLAWSPDAQYLAVGDDARLRVFAIPSADTVQTWEVTVQQNNYYAPRNIQWHDGGRKISWEWREAKYMYDFESNREWAWTVRVTDHSWGASNLFYLGRKGVVVTLDGDSTMRIWGV